jgi:drug/metabolite transporter (DMT)-like permease
MTLRDRIELVVLAAVWGASFLFMRLLAPVLGPWAAADLRMLFGAAFLGVFFVAVRFDPGLRRHAGVFLVVGLVNSALPFALYSAAALVLPASAEVVLNALSPVFGVLAGAWFLGERFTFRKLAGLVLGFAGVAVLSGGLELSSPWAWAAFGACLLAPACYAAGGVLVNKMAQGIPARSLAFGSQALAGTVLLPTVAFTPAAGWGDLGAWGLLAVFGVFCSGVAYLLYYGLMKRVGPTKTLTVTFLMPVFGILWGALFLGEPVTVWLAGGAILVLAGIFLVTR